MKPIQYIHTAGVFLLSAALLLPGCSSDDSSSTPANTLVITEANAASTIQGATTLTQLLLVLIEDAANSGSGPCNISGTVSINNTDSINGSVVTSAGTITATNCEVTTGTVINGSLSYSFTENTSTFADSVSINGSITINDNGDMLTISGLSFAETSDGAGNYTTSTISFSLSSSLGDSFSVMLTAPIVGNDAKICPDTGGIQVNGGSNTQTRATLITSGSQVMIELNTGTGFNEIANSPVACTTIFF